jgi:hypothetical protein
MDPAVWWGILTTVGMAAFGALVFANAALMQLIRIKHRWRALFGDRDLNKNGAKSRHADEDTA